MAMGRGGSSRDIVMNLMITKKLYYRLLEAEIIGGSKRKGKDLNRKVARLLAYTFRQGNVFL